MTNEKANNIHINLFLNSLANTNTTNLGTYRQRNQVSCLRQVYYRNTKIILKRSVNDISLEDLDSQFELAEKIISEHEDRSVGMIQF